MSEELKKGIPKARVTGKVEFTEKEKEQHDILFENVLKEYGILKKTDSLKDLKNK